MNKDRVRVPHNNTVMEFWVKCKHIQNHFKVDREDTLRHYDLNDPHSSIEENRGSWIPSQNKRVRGLLCLLKLNLRQWPVENQSLDQSNNVSFSLLFQLRLGDEVRYKGKQRKPKKLTPIWKSKFERLSH